MIFIDNTLYKKSKSRALPTPHRTMLSLENIASYKLAQKIRFIPSA